MNLGERKKEILRAVIDRYVDTAEPVGSKAIASALPRSVSPATIRNEMAELESLGLLEQPHTSAGRIPTALGYRIYVNELMRRHRMSIEEAEDINRALTRRVAELDRLISYAGKLASRVTALPAYALSVAPPDVTAMRFDLILVDANTFIVVVMLTGDTVKNKLVHLPTVVNQETLTRLGALLNANFTGVPDAGITSALLDSTARAAGDTQGLTAVVAEFLIELLQAPPHGDAHFTGELNLFGYPEYRDVNKAQRLIEYLSDESELLRLPTPKGGDLAKITIGPENLAEELRDSSVVVARYDMGGDAQLLLGVVGPTRMDYSKVITRLEYIARGIATLLSGEQTSGLPPGATHAGIPPHTINTGQDKDDKGQRSDDSG